MGGFLDKIFSASYVGDLEELYMLPSGGDVDPKSVDLSTSFSRSIRLKIPIASAPMDTVSEWRLASALAMIGGIGVIHRNMSIEDQVRNAEKVKEQPPIPLESIYLLPIEPCGRALDTMKKKGLRELPVVDANGVFRGYTRFSDLVEGCGEGITPVSGFIHSGRSFALEEAGEAYRYIARGEADLVAIVDRSGRYLGSLTVDGVMDDINPVLDHQGRLVVAAAVNPMDMERARKLSRVVDALVSDVAHYQNRDVIRASARLVKEISPDFIAGNIGTPEAALEAISQVERIDGLRVGVGGGSICTTPRVSGIFSPTWWAVASVRDALDANNIRIPIIADGGLRSASDIAKILALGASSAMLGYMLAGTDEAPADLVEVGGKLYKPYRGMASYTSMLRRYSIDRYSRSSKGVPEGVGGLVPYRGALRSVVREIVESLRISMGYVGARNIEDLWAKARFIRAPRKRVIGDDEYRTL